MFVVAVFNTIRMPIFITFGTSGIKFCFAFTTWFSIGFIVEIVEEIIEEYGVRQGEDNGPAWVAAIIEDQLKRMEKGDAELELKNESNNN